MIVRAVLRCRHEQKPVQSWPPGRAIDGILKILPVARAQRDAAEVKIVLKRQGRTRSVAGDVCGW